MIRKRPLNGSLPSEGVISLFPSPILCFQLCVPAAFFMMSYVFLIKQANILAANTSKYPAVESAKSVVKGAKASSKKYLTGNAQLLARPLFHQGIRWAQDILSVRYLMGSAASPNTTRRLRQSNTTLLPKKFSPSACNHKWGDKEENGTSLSQWCALKSAKLNAIFLPVMLLSKIAEADPTFSLPTCLLPFQWCPGPATL